MIDNIRILVYRYILNCLNLTEHIYIRSLNLKILKSKCVFKSVLIVCRYLTLYYDIQHYYYIQLIFILVHSTLNRFSV